MSISSKELDGIDVPPISVTVVRDKFLSVEEFVKPASLKLMNLFHSLMVLRCQDSNFEQFFSKNCSTLTSQQIASIKILLFFQKLILVN